MNGKATFGSILVSLWFRLITLAVILLMFCEALELAQGKAQGWSYYLNVWEVAFEIAVRMIATALAGVAFGTIVSAILAPFLAYFESSRQRLAEVATKLAVVVVMFLLSRYSFQALIRWSYLWFHHSALLDRALIVAFYLAFAAALIIARTRKEVVKSLDSFLTRTMTRRTALATLIGGAAMVGTQYALNKKLPTIGASSSLQRTKTNFILIIFDALTAEDMSLYGYKLTTTPNTDAFAKKATVFTNFYSTSTFTTPCIATILTGLYPSETLVYQLQGHIRTKKADVSLPQALKAGGYSNGAFLSNPFAYYFGKSLESYFNVMPEPVFETGGLQHVWDATTLLHQDTGIGSRVDEYRDLSGLWNSLSRLPRDMDSRFRAAASFDHAKQAIAQLPEGFFLWVHVMTPHYPYLPDAIDRGRFLKDSRALDSEHDDDRLWYPNYPPERQGQVDERRLRYDEFIATGDRAFGSFLAELERSGKLEDTTVIVSADHGESFEGGVYRHESPYQTRPVIHVPLIIRTPGQQEGRTVAVTSDQTALAPTILELAGLAKPECMRGQSLVEWLDRDNRGQNEGLAFGQHFERNCVFRPVRHGSISVIDGQFQYVLYLDTGKGMLRPLNEAQIWDLDRSAEHPERAAVLRKAIHSRFPNIV